MAGEGEAGDNTDAKGFDDGKDFDSAEADDGTQAGNGTKDSYCAEASDGTEDGDGARLLLSPGFVPMQASAPSPADGC